MQFGSSTNRDVYCISQQVQICMYVCVCVYAGFVKGGI